MNCKLRYQVKVLLISFKGCIYARKCVVAFLSFSFINKNLSKFLREHLQSNMENVKLQVHAFLSQLHPWNLISKILFLISQVHNLTVYSVFYDTNTPCLHLRQHDGKPLKWLADAKDPSLTYFVRLIKQFQCQRAHFATTSFGGKHLHFKSYRYEMQICEWKKKAYLKTSCEFFFKKINEYKNQVFY